MPSSLVLLLQVLLEEVVLEEGLLLFEGVGPVRLEPVPQACQDGDEEDACYGCEWEQGHS